MTSLRRCATRPLSEAAIVLPVAVALLPLGWSCSLDESRRLLRAGRGAVLSWAVSSPWSSGAAAMSNGRRRRRLSTGYHRHARRVNAGGSRGLSPCCLPAAFPSFPCRPGQPRRSRPLAAPGLRCRPSPCRGGRLLALLGTLECAWAA